MNTIALIALLSLGILVPAHGHNNTSWKEEGLAKSQDEEYLNNGYVGYGSYASKATPVSTDGRVVDTPEEAKAKAKTAHYAAKDSPKFWVPAIGSYAPATYTAWSPIKNDGSWKAEGLAESQDSKQYSINNAYASPIISTFAPIVSASLNDGSWKGEGLAESQDLGQYNKAYSHYGSSVVPVDSGQSAYAIKNDGSWKGEGLAESQDQKAYNTFSTYGSYAGGIQNDGSWKGEGLAESQDQKFNVYSTYGSDTGIKNDGSWKGEGLAQSQDIGQYNKIHSGYGLYVSAPFGAQNDGSWKGEGLAESQDKWSNTYATFGRYAQGATPLGPDGRDLDTSEVAHAKFAQFARAHSSW